MGCLILNNWDLMVVEKVSRHLRRTSAEEPDTTLVAGHSFPMKTRISNDHSNLLDHSAKIILCSRHLTSGETSRLFVHQLRLDIMIIQFNYVCVQRKKAD